MTQTTRLARVAEVRLGRQRSPENHFGPHMVPYLRSANVQSGRLFLNDVKTMNFNPQEQRIFALEDGDILVTEGSGSSSQVGASAVWDCSLAPPICFQNTLLRLRPRAALDGRYLYWWMQHAQHSGTLAEVAGGLNILHLSAEALANLPVRVPELTEQRTIADFLDDQVARIDQTVSARREQEQVALRGVESAAFHGVTATAVARRRPSPELPWSATLPAEWPVAKLSLVARMGSGHTPSRSEPDYWVDCDIPWLTTSDVHRFREDEIETIEGTTFEVSRLGLANSAAVLHPAGTVALSRTASAGFSIVMGPDMATSQDFVTWTCGPRIEPYYLLWCLRAMRRDLLERLAMGSTHKTIYFPDLQGLRIPIPPLVEQMSAVEMIRERVGDLHRVRATLARQIDLLEERKRSLITAAVTGELDVSSWSSRAAEAVVGS